MPESTARHLVGCAELPPGMNRGQYFDKLSLLEIAAFFTSSPSRKAVRGWREKSPESARFSIIASAELTHKQRCFPVDESAEAACANLVEGCAILQAEAVVFRTPASFTPSAANRERMQRFFSEVASAERFGQTERVWDPDGLWEPSGIGEMAEACDLLVALDPLAQDPLEEQADFNAEQMARGRAYLRIMGMGQSRRRFDAYQLEMLAEMLEKLERSWTLFGHPGKYPDALALAREIAAFEELPE